MVDRNKVFNNILTKDDYISIIDDIYKYYNLKDNIVCFFNGKKWNLVHLKAMLTYPILYFDFWSEKDETTYVNTLLVCPITLRAIIYKGKIKIIDIINDRLYLLNTDTNDEFFMDMPYTGHKDAQGSEKNIKSHIKRVEVKIVILRDVYIFANDPNYVKVNKPIDTIIKIDYYTNRLTPNGDVLYNTLHPKTLVYIVQYFSRKISKYRYSVIVGKDVSRDKISGYDYKKSQIWAYLDRYKREFIQKRAYIYTCFWYAIQKLYPDARIIILTDFK